MFIRTFLFSSKFPIRLQSFGFLSTVIIHSKHCAGTEENCGSTTINDIRRSCVSRIKKQPEGESDREGKQENSGAVCRTDCGNQLECQRKKGVVQGRQPNQGEN